MNFTLFLSVTQRIIPDPLRSVVVDGITVGHPCCGVHNCSMPLENLKDRFCISHKEYERKCAVVDCLATIHEEKFQTCSDPVHREYELRVCEQGKAMFQLCDRLRRVRTSQTHDALSAEVPIADDESGALEGSGVGDDHEILIDSEGNECDGKLPTGNRKVKARLGRRRTHNEELCVASCGVILGRTTFFGSESPTNVRVSSHQLRQLSLIQVFRNS